MTVAFLSCHNVRMDDFQKALLQWKEKRRLLSREIGELLDPPASPATVSSWMKGVAEPKKGHRGQLVKLSRGIIKPRHFL